MCYCCFGLDCVSIHVFTILQKIQLLAIDAMSPFVNMRGWECLNARELGFGHSRGVPTPPYHTHTHTQYHTSIHLTMSWAH